MKVLIPIAALALALDAYAQRAPQSIPSLKKTAIPAPPNLSTYVRDPAALVVLGKALFWDMQVGSDGKVACASCHFHAGADHRDQNQLANPLGAFVTNYKLTAADFPFHKLADVTNSASQVIRDSTQRAGSAGVFLRKFTGVIPGLPNDEGAELPDSVFGAPGGLKTRQVTGRNAPSVINAVFYFRNFWDGRASNVFTGSTPFGVSDTRSAVLSNATGSLQPEPLRLQNSSLASQAVGPVLNNAEMSYDARTWPNVGRKVLALRPLAYQKIAGDDSILGPFANASGRGFTGTTTYLDMVKSAFQPSYWNSTDPVVAASVPGASFTQAEVNFSLFFGLAVQAYESTLVSDDTRLDRFADGQMMALNMAEMRGMFLFTGRAGCVACHGGAELSLATHSGVNGNDPLKVGEDTGFFHIGVRPIGEDAGLGDLDGFGKPLARMLPTDASPVSSRGRFKTPSLRNIEFTGPYFHDGGQATLEQTTEFYNRGADFPPNTQNGPDIRPLQLSAGDQADLLAFLKALSDDRVKFERAPFDHPELCVVNGHSASRDGNPAFSMSAADRWVGLPPVGRNGNSVPLQTFEELLAGIGRDGSRAHHMNDACGIEAITATGFVNQNAASFRTSIAAQSSIVSAFGMNMTVSAMVASTNPAPTALGGITVNIEDSAGVIRPAPLFYVSPTQVNYAIPDGSAVGPATVRIVGGSTSFRSPLLITTVSPGLFGAGGLAAANVLTIKDGVRSTSNVIGSGGALVPIDLGSEDQQVYLILYGTGIRYHTNPVTAMLGTATATAAYAGPQGEFAGEDQINILLPRSLKGAGVIGVTLNVDGQTSNTVKIQVQ